MERDALQDLETWMSRTRRKPLVIRGARQVGKTTLVRLFAARCFESLAEVDFERDPSLADLFAGNQPRATLRNLEVYLGQAVVPGRTLLFLDEIQAAPQVFSALRYFYEDLPEMHVVAAGSLLELVLEEPAFPVPVGRIEYLYLGPMSFEETLLAAGDEHLMEFLREHELGTEIPPPIHQRLMSRVRTFLIVGGMPDAVQAYLEGDSFRESEIVKRSILSTFHDDFGKYRRRVPADRIRKVFERLPHLVGAKFKYVHVDRGERAKDLGDALRLLCLARVAYRVRRTAANGVPLGAEADERYFKALCLDVGMMTTATGLTILELEGTDELLSVGRGAATEQFVGQHLLYSAPSWEEPQLYCWAREKRGAESEVDYVISQGSTVVPVEVKAGRTGTLKSLHVFLREKKRHLGVRLSGAPLSFLRTTTSLSDGRNVPFHLLSLPLYLVGQVRRLLGAAADLPGSR